MFSAEVSDFQTIYNVLKAISFKDYAIVRPMAEGLKFTLEDMKSVEISAYIPRNMFMCYKVDDREDNIFKISMKILTECLNILDDEANCSLKMSYKGQGEPLQLLMKHSEINVTIDSSIKTINMDDFVDVSLSEECNLNKIVIEAPILLEILQRLDNLSDEVTFEIDTQPPYFTLTSTGIAGESIINISKNSDCVSIFQCKEKSSAKYAFSNIRPILKVMHYASRVAVSNGDSGLLGLQLSINSEEKQMFVEYYVTSQVNNDDD